MYEVIFIPIILVSIVFPIAYIFIKKGSNKLLFIAASYGFTLVIQVLLFGLVSPYILLELFFIPQLEEFGYMKNIDFLTTTAYWVRKYGFFVTLLLHIPVSIGVYRRYGFFNGVRSIMSFAIQNMEGRHHGFILMAEKDCIFRSLPNESDQFKTIEAELLFELQNIGEFQHEKTGAVIKITNPNYSEVITIADSTLNIGGNKFKVIELGNS